MRPKKSKKKIKNYPFNPFGMNSNHHQWIDSDSGSRNQNSFPGFFLSVHSSLHIVHIDGKDTFR